MAQAKQKETEPNPNPSPVGHAMIGDTLDAPVLQRDLAAEIRSLQQADAWLQGTGPSSKTIVKHSDLRIVLLAMKKNVCMHEHRTAARISVQTLSGHIRLKLPDRTVELPAGQLLALDQCLAHDVEAVEDSVFLLTVAWRGQEAETCTTD